MVLEQLGGSLAGALKRMRRATVVDDKVLSDCLNDVSRALLQADVRFETVRAVAAGIKTSANLAALPPGADRRRAVHRAVAGELRNMLDPAASSGSSNSTTPPPPFTPTSRGGGNKPSSSSSSVVMLVGLQGSGKTTTCTKYADHYRRKGFSPALVCADTFRAGALDQLKQNAAKAGIPFYGSYTESDPAKIAVAGVETFRAAGRDLIVVDTSGRHRQEAALFEEMRQVSEAIRPDLVIFVMDASIGQAAFDQASAFRRSAPVGAVIVTKMDGHARGGGALSAVAATKSPVIFIGTGEHIQDLEPFDARRFVNRLLGMGDLPGLIEKIHDVVVPADDDEQQLADLMAGDFTLRLMRRMFRSIQSMGPLGQLVSMIPGFSAEEFVDKGKEKEGQAKIRRYTTITSSMTAEELDATNPNKLMNESRIRRVARGSGRPVKEVVEMLEEHRRIAKLWSKLPMRRKLNTNNRDVLKPLVNALPPGMVNQLGGLNGLQNMVKEMGAIKRR